MTATIAPAPPLAVPDPPAAVWLHEVCAAIPSTARLPAVRAVWPTGYGNTA